MSHEQVQDRAELAIHFFTIVLNGEPFIRYHIDQFRQLPFRWHWHIVEGVAEHKFDTAWSLTNGASIPAELHREGRSNDGTSEYLDELKARYPDQISIYRKPLGEFWQGKLEMVNAPLAGLIENCLLWQVDADEFWDSEQMVRARQLFLKHPEKRAAFFRCHFYVGPAKVISTYDTYGNQTAFEWLRLWRFRPGDRWISHEPPTLASSSVSALVISLVRICEKLGSNRLLKNIKIIPRMVRRFFRPNPNNAHFFSQDMTQAEGLIFNHYAYVISSQLAFKEVYYGYNSAHKNWTELQSCKEQTIYLKNYFPWVKDDAQVVDASSKELPDFHHLNIPRLS